MSQKLPSDLHTCTGIGMDLHTYKNKNRKIKQIKRYLCVYIYIPVYAYVSELSGSHPHTSKPLLSCQNSTSYTAGFGVSFLQGNSSSLPTFPQCASLDSPDACISVTWCVCVTLPMVTVTRVQQLAR